MKIVDWSFHKKRLLSRKLYQHYHMSLISICVVHFATRACGERINISTLHGSGNIRQEGIHMVNHWITLTVVMLSGVGVRGLCVVVTDGVSAAR